MPAMYLATGRTAGTEISSTYEGRHITIEESLLAHPSHPADGFVDKGDPVLLGEDIIGVALLSAAAATDFISIDTEGIWFLSALAEDDDGASAIAPGDALYLNKTTCIISKIMNKHTHQHFGYSLGDIAAGTDIVAVKVHWDPDDAEEQVGTGAVPFVSTKNGHIFREYRYEPQGTGGHRGIYCNLELTEDASWGEAIRGRAVVNATCPTTVAGGHFGIEFDTDGALTGLGVGLRGTYLAKDAAAAASVAGGMSELFAAGASTDYAAAIEHSIHRFVNDGEATGKATAENTLSFQGLSAVQLQAHNAWVAGLTSAIRILVDGDIRYLGVSNAP